MKDKIIELIQESVGGCARHWAEIIANHLIDKGVAPPCEIGDTVWLNRTFHSRKVPQKGVVSEVKFINYGGNPSFQIVVKCIGRGTWGKEVFPTFKEAEDFIEGSENGK